MMHTCAISGHLSALLEGSIFDGAIPKEKEEKKKKKERKKSKMLPSSKAGRRLDVLFCAADDVG